MHLEIQLSPESATLLALTRSRHAVAHDASLAVSSPLKPLHSRPNPLSLSHPPVGTERSVAAKPSGLDWRRSLWQRMSYRPLLKTVGISLFISIFFIGYFHLLRYPAFTPFAMPLTALDLAIPFQPSAIVAYLSLWVYVGVAPGLQDNLRALVVYGLWAALLCGVGLASFYFLPTTVPPRWWGDVDPQRHPAFALLQGIDAAGNACPSMHVATAVFTAVRLHHLLRQLATPAALRVASLGWCALIVYSTLAIKQHVVLDVLVGALLGLTVALVSLRSWRAQPRTLPRDPGPSAPL